MAERKGCIHGVPEISGHMGQAQSEGAAAGANEKRGHKNMPHGAKRQHKMAVFCGFHADLDSFRPLHHDVTSSLRWRHASDTAVRCFPGKKTAGMALLLWNRLTGLRHVLLTGRMWNAQRGATAGLKSYEPPPDFKGVVMKERPKLRFMNKAPDLVKVVRVPRNLRDIRGPATEGRDFREGEYGILALGGGYLRWGHFEMLRLTLNRKFNPETTFSVWLVEAPHKPITRKGLGQRMGGGKGAVDHYVTPVKAEQLILEVGGRCEFQEVLPVLEQVAKKLPFPAQAVSRESLRQMREEEEERRTNNQNPWTFQRLVANNMMGCRKYLCPNDLHYKGRYWGKNYLKDRV